MWISRWISVCKMANLDEFSKIQVYVSFTSLSKTAYDLTCCLPLYGEPRDELIERYLQQSSLTSLPGCVQVYKQLSFLFVSLGLSFLVTVGDFFILLLQLSMIQRSRMVDLPCFTVLKLYIYSHQRLYKFLVLLLGFDREV